MKKKICLLLFLSFTMSYCQNNQAPKASTKEENMDFKNNLEKQIIAGYGAEKYETDYPNYSYTEEDLASTIRIIKDSLKANGFKFLDKETFNKRIKDVFGRILDPTSLTKYVQLNFDDRCARDLKFWTNDNSVEQHPFSLYIIKNDFFLTALYPIPELINYQKIYPNIVQIENTLKKKQKGVSTEEVKTFFWMDKTDSAESRKKNIKTIIARNSYLFNDTKAYVNWLIAQDQDFVKNLVVTYGYTQEPKFNEFIIKKFQKDFPNDGNEIGKVVFVRTCDGKLECRTGLLDSYTSIIEQEKIAKMILPLKYYSAKVIENKEKLGYNEKERMKVIAYLANTFDPLFQKYHHADLNWGTLTILADYKDILSESSWKKVEEEYKVNNYYNLPNLKAMVEYANQFDSVGAPD